MKSQAERDSEWLLQEKYGGEKSAAFFADCKALALGEPLAYLIGHTPFLGCTIYLDGRPLIPRPETEFWVEKAIEVITQESDQPNLLSAAAEPMRILDLCAGSGCIGVAAVKHIPSAHIDFTEIDAALLPTIKKNCKENDVGLDQYNIIHSNLFQALKGGTKYDFILSNPPYIDPALNRVDENVKDFEPHLSLFGGKGGTEIIESVIQTAPNHLKIGGQLWIEHEPEQVSTLHNSATEHGFSITTYTDQYDMKRYSVLILENTNIPVIQ